MYQVRAVIGLSKRGKARTAAKESRLRFSRLIFSFHPHSALIVAEQHPNPHHSDIPCAECGLFLATSHASPNAAQLRAWFPAGRPTISCHAPSRTSSSRFVAPPLDSPSPSPFNLLLQITVILIANVVMSSNARPHAPARRPPSLHGGRPSAPHGSSQRRGAPSQPQTHR